MGVIMTMGRVAVESTSKVPLGAPGEADNIIWIKIQAVPANTASLWIGGADVEANSGSETGLELLPGDKVELVGSRYSSGGRLKLTDIWIDTVSASNQAITYIANRVSRASFGAPTGTD